MAALSHSPSHIVRQLFVELGGGSAFNAGQPWPVFDSVEPATPDQVITVYDTPGRSDGRSMIDGELFEHFGIQVRVRSKEHEAGWVKAEALRTMMAITAYEEAIHVSSAFYLVHCFAGIGQVLPLGREVGVSARKLFTINAVVSIRQLS